MSENTRITNLLITGGCGFIGSNFIHYVLKSNPDINIINLDKLTYAGNPDNLADIELDDRYTLIYGDITNSERVDYIFKKYDFDAVVHFAAESHVDRSVSGPEVFTMTNVFGTQVLLEAARKQWNGRYSEKMFIHISTDEVYGSLGAKGYFTETTPLAPNSPYSASKAGSDMLVRSYHVTYGFPAIITRCSNNYGPYQYPEKLIPLMITNAMNNLPLPVYGDGKNVRDWIYVDDHCDAIWTVLNKGKSGEVYNIGGNNEWCNIDIIKNILFILKKPESLITFVADRLGHDRRYAINALKIKKELGWKPKIVFEDGLLRTVNWYAKQHENNKN